MFFTLVRLWTIGAYLRFEIVETRHSVVIKSLYPALARILNQNERLGNVAEIMPARIIFFQKQPVQVAGGEAAAGFSSTLSPQPQAEVWLGFSKTKVEANCVVFTSIFVPSR